MNTHLLKQNKVVLEEDDENKPDAKKIKLHDNLISCGSSCTSFENYNFLNFCKENLQKCQEKKTLKESHEFSEKGNID